MLIWTGLARNMPQNSPIPSLTALSAPEQLFTLESCTSSSRIRAFLRLSRIATDDTIRQHLNEIQPEACSAYFRTKIAPQWKARQELIRFCGNTAADLRKATDTDGTSAASPEIDLRLDPYALKEYRRKLDDQYSQCQMIEQWVENERGVEAIVRGETASVLNDKCYYNDWMGEFRRVSGEKR